MQYRLLLLVPIILLAGSVAILSIHYGQTGQWFERSIQLEGGTLITAETSVDYDLSQIDALLSDSFGDVHTRELSGLSGYALLIETETDVDPQEVVALLGNSGVEITDYSVETIGSALGESFWAQAQFGIIAAFVLMGIIVLAIFRTFVPSFAVILCAASDIIITLALMQVFGIELSLPTLAALLMLIGYSIDTDILLTTRLLKTREGNVSQRVRNTFKTGATITGTTIGVLVAILVFNASVVLSEIAAVLLIGLAVDMVNTWLQNAVLLRWYCERKGI